MAICVFQTTSNAQSDSHLVIGGGGGKLTVSVVRHAIAVTDKEYVIYE